MLLLQSCGMSKVSDAAVAWGWKRANGSGMLLVEETNIPLLGCVYRDKEPAVTCAILRCAPHWGKTHKDWNVIICAHVVQEASQGLTHRGPRCGRAHNAQRWGGERGYQVKCPTFFFSVLEASRRSAFRFQRFKSLWIKNPPLSLLWGEAVPWNVPFSVCVSVMWVWAL